MLSLNMVLFLCLDNPLTTIPGLTAGKRVKISKNDSIFHVFLHFQAMLSYDLHVLDHASQIKFTFYLIKYKG